MFIYYSVLISHIVMERNIVWLAETKGFTYQSLI